MSLKKAKAVIFYIKIYLFLVCACPEDRVIIEYNKSYSYKTPGFPLEYCDNSNCSTKISARITNLNELNNVSYSHVIRIKFENFETESVDTVELFEQRSLLT